MSLATSGGLGGGGGHAGGLVLGHQAGSGVGQPGAPPPPPSGGEGGGTHVPPSAAVLGADLLDRQQNLQLRYVRNTAELPLVAIDLCTSDPHVAFFPAKPEDPSEPVPPRLVGKTKATVCFNATEESHKTLRKYLGSSKSYFDLQKDSISKTAKGAVVVDRPHQLLGLRRLSDAPDFIVAKLDTDDGRSATPATAPEQEKKPPPSEPGVVVVNGTLDGSSTPKNDDYDRVVYKVRVCSSKKALTMLPEEAVQVLVHRAQQHVAVKVQQDPDDEDVLQYPVAVALPAWMSHDAAIEAVVDATGGNGVFFQRSVCALAGALMLGPDGQPNALLERIQVVRQALAKDYARARVEDPDAAFEDDVLLLLFGLLEDGFECTAIQVSTVQKDLTTCLFGDYKVLSNVSCRAENAVSVMEQCCTDLRKAIDTLHPEADGPAGIVTYGTPQEQDKVRKTWEEIKKQQPDWKKVPVFPSKSDCVAMGTAILGAVSHGRQLVLVEKGDSTKAALGLRVQNVAPAAVGVRLNYFGGDADKWTPVKTIFDFDRRIPAGPYQMDFSASECVVHREQNDGPQSSLDEEAFLKAAKERESAKHIPEREEAALGLRVQLVQKWTRTDEWKPLGDPFKPLVKLEGGGDLDDYLEGDEADEKDMKSIGCESVMFQVSLGVNGMITTGLVGDL